MPIVKREFDYSEAPVSGVELAEEILKNRHALPIVKVYFSHLGFICGECDNVMATDGLPKEGKSKAFCTNPYCSQNLITKIIDLPFSISCIVSPSDV